MDTPSPGATARATVPRRRLIRAGKWAGAVLSVLIAAGYPASGVWPVVWTTDPGNRILAVHGALIRMSHTPVPGGNWRPGPPRVLWDLQCEWYWRPRMDTVGVMTSVIMPLWLPCALLAIPTAVLFYLDGASARRRRAGQCENCGYDRAGLAPASACPECNAPPPPAATPAQ